MDPGFDAVVVIIKMYALVTERLMLCEVQHNPKVGSEPHRLMYHGVKLSYSFLVKHTDLMYNLTLKICIPVNVHRGLVILNEASPVLSSVATTGRS